MTDESDIEVGKQVRDLYKSADSSAAGRRFPVRESWLGDVSCKFPRNVDGLTLEEHLGNLPKDSKVLDIGAGSGAAALEIEKTYPVIQVYALTPNKCEKLEDDQVVVGGLQTLRVNKGAVKELQEKGPFDVTYAHWVYRHLPDPLAVLKTQWMLTKKGGDMYGDGINLFESSDISQRWVGKLLRFWELIGVGKFQIVNIGEFKDGSGDKITLDFVVRKTGKRLPIPVNITGIRGEEGSKWVEYGFDDELAKQILNNRGLPDL